MTRGRRASPATVLGLALALALGGCGYSFQGTLPSHIQTIAVPIFANSTQTPAVESFITRAVVEAFSTNGRLRVVRSEDADAILDGTVTTYALSPISFDPTINATEYRLTVTLALRMRDVHRNAVLLDRSVTEQSDFRVLGPVSQTISAEEGALRAAATDIGRAVVMVAINRF